METMNVLWQKVKTALRSEDLPKEYSHLKHGDPRDQHLVQYHALSPVRFTR